MGEELAAELDRGRVALDGFPEKAEGRQGLAVDLEVDEGRRRLAREAADLVRAAFFEVEDGELEDRKGRVVGYAAGLELAPNLAHRLESLGAPAETGRDPRLEPSDAHPVDAVAELAGDPARLGRPRHGLGVPAEVAEVDAEVEGEDEAEPRLDIGRQERRGLFEGLEGARVRRPFAPR